MFLRSLVTVGILLNAVIGSLCVSQAAEAASLGALHEGHGEHAVIADAVDESDRTEKACCEGHSLSPSAPAVAVHTQAADCPAVLPCDTSRFAELAEEQCERAGTVAPPIPRSPVQTVVLLQ